MVRPIRAYTIFILPFSIQQLGMTDVSCGLEQGLQLHFFLTNGMTLGLSKKNPIAPSVLAST